VTGRRRPRRPGVSRWGRRSAPAVIPWWCGLGCTVIHRSDLAWLTRRRRATCHVHWTRQRSVTAHVRPHVCKRIERRQRHEEHEHRDAPHGKRQMKAQKAVTPALRDAAERRAGWSWPSSRRILGLRCLRSHVPIVPARRPWWFDSCINCTNTHDPGIRLDFLRRGPSRTLAVPSRVPFGRAPSARQAGAHVHAARRDGLHRPSRSTDDPRGGGGDRSLSSCHESPHRWPRAGRPGGATVIGWWPAGQTCSPDDRSEGLSGQSA